MPGKAILFRRLEPGLGTHQFIEHEGFPCADSRSDRDRRTCYAAKLSPSRQRPPFEALARGPSRGGGAASASSRCSGDEAAFSEGTPVAIRRRSVTNDLSRVFLGLDLRRPIRSRTPRHDEWSIVDRSTRRRHGAADRTYTQKTTDPTCSQPQVDACHRHAPDSYGAQYKDISSMSTPPSGAPVHTAGGRQSQSGASVEIARPVTDKSTGRLRTIGEPSGTSQNYLDYI